VNDNHREGEDVKDAHGKVFEYDGAFWCLDCGAQWGALPKDRPGDGSCTGEVSPQPDARSELSEALDEILYHPARWCVFCTREKGRPHTIACQSHGIESLFDRLQEQVTRWRIQAKAYMHAAEERDDYEAALTRLRQERDGCTRCGGEDRVLLCRECRGEVAERDARWTDEEVRDLMATAIIQYGPAPGRRKARQAYRTADAILREAKQQRGTDDA
jgi:hypothetical protein